MSKICPISNRRTNCTENCKACLEEEKKYAEMEHTEVKINTIDYADLLMEQQEQM